MSIENNQEEEKAIKSLERAFKKCSDLGLKFSVMDNDLFYANKRLYKECEKFSEKESNYSGKYPTVAYAQDTDLGECLKVKCYNSMESCGGW